MLSLIVAVAKNGAIGKNNELLWHITEDLKYFKTTTMGHPVIMGRKTFESIGRVLPGRKNIIVSRSNFTAPPFAKYKKDGSPTNTSVEVCNNLTSLLENLSNDKNSKEEIFVIGGGSIYKEAFKYAQKLYITHIDSEIAGADTFFPKINPEEWEIENKSHQIFDKENNLYFRFIVYKRKNITL